MSALIFRTLTVLVCALALAAPVLGGDPNINPFSGAVFFNMPSFDYEVQLAMAEAGSSTAASTRMDVIRSVPTAYWLDVTAKVSMVTTLMDLAVQRLNKQPAGTKMVIAFVVYNLPNRDCAAWASNGELHAAQNGLNLYQSNYINAIYNALAPYQSTAPNLRVVLFMEPDSLPNIASNVIGYNWPEDKYMDLSGLPQGGQYCRDSADVYFRGASYAIRTLGLLLSNTWLYLDSGHRGWLGYPRNLIKGAHVFKHTLAMAGGWEGDPFTTDPDSSSLNAYVAAGASMIRGFVSNVANAQPLQGGSAAVDAYDVFTDEASYANGLLKALADVGITGKGWVVDTSRNGRDVYGLDGHLVKNWCNIPNAGFGRVPAADVHVTATSGYDNYKGENPKAVSISAGLTLDAVYWVKTPGESDGTSDPASPRFDQFCGYSHQAQQYSPEAGVFWPSYFVTLAQHASPAFEDSTLPCMGCSNGTCLVDSHTCACDTGASGSNCRGNDAPGVSYVTASEQCADMSRRLCTVGELQSGAAAGYSFPAAVWVLASVGDVRAQSGTLYGGRFTLGSSEDMTRAHHWAVCCNYGEVGVSNVFATEVRAEIDACPSGYDATTDANRGAKGKFVYICTAYRRADAVDDNAGLLADLTVVASGSSSVGCPGGYTKLPLDLNAGAGGKFIYLCALYSSTDSRAIVDVYVARGQCYSDYEQINQDLNEGAGGDFLYLCFKRTNRHLKYLADPTVDVGHIARFSPAIHISQRERFFPVSVDQLLASKAAGIYTNNAHFKRDTWAFPLMSIGDLSPCQGDVVTTGECTPIHSQEEFQNFGNVDQSYCFGYSATDHFEDIRDWHASSRAGSKVYYSVQRQPNGGEDHVLITFALLYRWNGCVHYQECDEGTRLCSVAIAGDKGRVQHMGDIERLSVLVDRTLTRVIGIETEKHGGGSGYPAFDYPSAYAGGWAFSGPHVYISAETHGVYATDSLDNTGAHTGQECHACDGQCFYCECWEPWVPRADELVRVGRKSQYPHAANGGNWVDGQYWQRFPGRFGCGAGIDSADKTGVSSFSYKWFVTSATYPGDFVPPVNKKTGDA